MLLCAQPDKELQPSEAAAALKAACAHVYTRALAAEVGL